MNISHSFRGNMKKGLIKAYQTPIAQFKFKLYQIIVLSMLQLTHSITNSIHQTGHQDDPE